MPFIVYTKCISKSYSAHKHWNTGCECGKGWWDLAKVKVTKTEYFMLLILMGHLTECHRSVIDRRLFTPKVKPSSMKHSESEQMSCDSSSVML